MNVADRSALKHAVDFNLRLGHHLVGIQGDDPVMLTVRQGSVALGSKPGQSVGKRCRHIFGYCNRAVGAARVQD